MELLDDALGGLINLATDSFKELEKLANFVFYNLSMVNNNIQWVSHLMRNRRIDQSNQLLLTFQRLLGQDLVRLVYKADYE